MSKKLKIRQLVKLCMRKIVFPVIYKAYCCRYRSIDSKLAVFADAHHKVFPEDMLLIKERMQEKGFKVVEQIYDFANISFGASIKIMLAFMRDYARAGYIVLCDYYLPVISVKKRKETKVIQLWHACGAYKKFGYDAKEDLMLVKEQHLFENFDLVTVSAPECRKIYAEAFHLPQERIQALGISRTDKYFSKDYLQECRRKFFEEYPCAVGKKIILWAPTFRENAGVAKIIGGEEIDWLSEQLKSDWYIIKKVHPHAEKKTGASNCSIPTEQLYGVADLLITDYSSVVFEFALTGKPIILFAPDRKEYESRRGFYLEPEEFPARVINTKEELAQVIREESYTIEKEKYETFVQRQLQMCDGESTERIIDYMMQM